MRTLSATLIAFDEPSDFDPVPEPSEGKADVAGIPAVFDRHLVMSDALFTDIDTVDAAELQAFFEATPYGNRSWLADATIDGVPAGLVDVRAGLKVNLRLAATGKKVSAISIVTKKEDKDRK